MKESPAFPAVTKRAHLVTFLSSLLTCLVAVLWMAGPYLLALFLGGTLAMLAFPAYQYLRARKCPPRLAAAAITVQMLLLVIAPLTGFSILAAKQGIAIGRDLAELKEFSPKAITAALSRFRLVRMLIGDPAHVDAQLKSALRTAGQFTSSSVLKMGEGIPQFMLQALLTLIAFFFFLLDGERFMNWILSLGALDRIVQRHLIDSFRGTTISALLAGLAAAASQAALITSGFFLLEVPGPFLAGGLTFILAWIPMLGTAPASMAGLIYLYAQGSSFEMALMIFLAIAACAVDNLVRTMVLKGRAGMHPLLGFVVIISGIRMYGILGVLIGPLVAATLLSLLRSWPVIGAELGVTAPKR